MYCTRLIWLLLSLALIPASAHARSWKEIQREFARKYASTDWNQKVAAVRLLAEGNNKAACKVLAAILKNSDREVTSTVKEVAKTNKKLKPYAGRNRFTTDELNEKKRLEKVLGEQNEKWKGWDKVGDAALDTLARMNSAEAKQWLLTTGLKQGPWRQRAAVAKALGGIGGEDVIGPLMDGVKTSDPRVSTACIDALGKLKVKKAAEIIAKKLKHKRWQVRSAAAGALANMGATEKIPGLIDQLAKESGRLVDDINKALVKLTGVDKDGNVVQWRAWYAQNKAKLADGPPRVVKRLVRRGESPEGGRTTSFYGITTKSKAIVFVIDRSGSMETPAGGKEQKQNVVLSGKHSNALQSVKGGRKIDVAKRELIKAIVGLDKRARFTIIWYNEAVMPWKSKMMHATDQIKDQAIKEIKKLEPKGATNIFDSVERAFGLAGLGMVGKDYMSGADTVFLLSDGSPNQGRITAPDEIVKAVAKMNATRKITIHTIGIGTGHNSNFMRQLAEQNGGEYVSRK